MTKAAKGTGKSQGAGAIAAAAGKSLHSSEDHVTRMRMVFNAYSGGANAGQNTNGQAGGADTGESQFFELGPS